MPPDTQGLPWPEGDPGAVRAAAGRAASLSATLQGLSGRFSGVDAAGWSGTAASAFDGAVSRDAAALEAASAAFAESAGALDELAARLEDARERVLEAARRLREAREAAAAARSQAESARAAATSAHAAAALEPAGVFGGLLANEATAAEDAAMRAEAASAAAEQELARVEAWARREAEEAVQDARAADQRVAGVLEGAAGGAGLPGAATGTPSAAPASGGALGPLGEFLNGSLFNFWGGGPGREDLPLGKMVAGGAFMYGTARWLPEWFDYRVTRNAMGARAPLAWWARTQMLDRLPTFNNGVIGRGLARGLSATPGLRGAGTWLGSASRATPVFRRLGIAGGAVSTVLDAKHLIEQGNPVDAFQRDGAGYVADVGRTAFSASTTAFLIAPNPVTGGAVIVSGAVWAGAEIWDHREEIGRAVATGADWAWDHSLVGAAWNHREEIGAALDRGLDMAQDFGGEVGERLDQGVDMVEDGLSSVGERAGDVWEAATPW